MLRFLFANACNDVGAYLIELIWAMILGLLHGFVASFFPKDVTDFHFKLFKYLIKSRRKSVCKVFESQIK